MDNIPTVYQFLGIMVSLVGVVTGSSIYYMRKNTERMEERTKEVYDFLSSGQKELKGDIKEFSSHINERFDKMYSRMDVSAAELKEYVAREVSSLKAKDMDLDIKLENVRDRINDTNEELLKFKIEVSEKYVKKTDWRKFPPH